MKKLILLFTMILAVTFAFAQRTIKGTVKEANGDAIIGANVIAKGTKAVTTTDIDGNFTLNVPKEATQLEITYVGMATQLITLGKDASIEVTMRPDKTLEEVVVIGYGTQKRKDLTGSVTSISSENFVKGAVQTPEQLIAGKVAGVQITSNGGRPGAGSTIRIRGGSSLNANNEPLIVIDGVPVESALKADGTSTINGVSNPLSFVNPSDIESVTVLKDASATAIFGSRASNGVIMIVTKRGEKGIQGSFSSQMTYSEVTKLNPVLTGDEFRAFVAKQDTSLLKYLGKANTNWQKAVLQNAVGSDNNLSVSGKMYDQVPFRVSFNLANFQGVLKNSDMKRSGLTIGLSPKMLDNHLKIDLNYKGSRVENRFSDQGSLSSAVAFDPTQPIRSSSSEYGGYFEWLAKDNSPYTLAPRNPVSLVDNKIDKSSLFRQIANAQFDYKFHFLPDLRAILNVGIDKVESRGDKLTPSTLAASFYNKGYSGYYTQNKTNKLLDFYFNYNKGFGVSKIDLTTGYSYQDFINDEFTFDKDGNKPDPTKSYAYKTQYTLLSFFGRASYTLNDKYLLTATVRNDRSSRFSQANRSGIFPSLALAWKIKEEGFLKDSKLFSDLKLRLGYGSTGQQDVGGNYLYLPSYTISQLTASYQLGNTFYRTYRPSGYPGDLKWERTYTYNAALDYGFMNGRIFGSIDFYNRLTKDLLSEVNVPAGTNLTNRIVTNVGNLTNKGVEFSMSFLPIQNEKTSWSVTFNATYNKNTITNLSIPDTKIDKEPLFETGGIAGGVGNNIQANTVGYPRNTFRVYQQVYDKNGKPIEGFYVDKNNDGKINSDDYYLYKGGSADPKVFLGLSSNYTSGNFSAGFAMRGNFGNYVYNNFASNRGVVDFYNQQGFLQNQHPEVNVSGFKKFNYFSDYYLENASFVRMDNIYLGYRIADRRNKPTVFTTLTFSVQNAFVITKYSGIDPEHSSGIDNNIYPRPRIYSFGIKLDW
jgi:TonB-dependent starch-binding outer membrane protein SusC